MRTCLRLSVEPDLGSGGIRTPPDLGRGFAGITRSQDAGIWAGEGGEGRWVGRTQVPGLQLVLRFAPLPGAFCVISRGGLLWKAARILRHLGGGGRYVNVEIITEMGSGELSTCSGRWKRAGSCGRLGSLVCAQNHLEALAGPRRVAADANDLGSLTA